MSLYPNLLEDKHIVMMTYHSAFGERDKYLKKRDNNTTFVIFFFIVFSLEGYLTLVPGKY